MATGHQYGQLAAVYAFTAPAALSTTEGSFAAFRPVLDGIPHGAPVLDCACGTGELAAGLAAAGFDVAATDASPEMVERASALAGRTGVPVDVAVVPWDALAGRGWEARFQAVFCVGNSLMHAAGPAARRQALSNMAAVTAPGGRLAVTSRNWELVRAGGSGIHVEPSVVERQGRRGVVIHDWIVAERWEDQHDLHVAVALLGPDGHTVSPVSERLSFWPFRHEQLLAELEDAGYAVEQSSYQADAERYLVTARRRTV